MGLTEVLVCAGVGMTNIYGQTYAVTTGVLHYIGGAISSTANSFSFMGVGNTVAVNQGDLLWVGFAQGRATLAQSQVGPASTQKTICEMSGMPTNGSIPCY